MLDTAKLNLTGPRRRAARDLWRVLSDLFGGTLAVAVWLALWTWIAVGVVRPLSGVVERPAQVTARSGT
jgi:hypothetical protein